MGLRRLLGLLGVALLLTTSVAEGRGAGGGGGQSGSSVGGSHSGGSGQTWVHGYTRKDGTSVSGYWRGESGTGTSAGTGPHVGSHTGAVSPSMAHVASGYVGARDE